MPDNKPEEGLNPYEFLKQFPGAPSAEQIEQWKQQVPGGRVRLKASSDFKRVYILRAISGTELAQLQARMPAGIPPEKIPIELQIAVSCFCCLWTNATQNGKLDEMTLRASGSGLPVTLHEVISVLSDYETPDVIERLSADL